MTDETNLVPGAEGGVSQVETPNPASDVAVTTPVTVTTPPVDVEMLKAKYEKDVANIKSSLDRRTAQVEQQWQSRYANLQKEMHNIRMQGMNEEERGRYERQIENEEFQGLQSRLAELEQKDAQQAATVNAFSFFIQQGVPADKLNLSEGYDAVANAGWQYLTSELTELRAARTNPQPQPAKPEPAPLKGAPSVVTDKGTPASGTTWAALRTQFGTDEAIYRAVEEGRLDPSVIPS